MKTGIITFHFVNNFGGALQAYALRRFMDDHFKGEIELIDYRHWFIRFTDAVRMFPVTTNVKYFGPWLRSFKRIKRRRRRFAEFMKENGNLSRRYNYPWQLGKIGDEYQMLVCGSDQIWNSMLTFGVSGPYYLRFGSANTRRISYAASVGKNTRDRGKMLDYLKDMDAISIREPIDWLERSGEIRIEHHIDPTFLIDRRIWDSIAIKPKTDEKYILTYFMQMDDNAYSIVRQIREKTGYKVYDISRYGYQPDCVDQCFVDIGPEEFVGLFSSAQQVCTNSFHGLAFSLIYDKQVDYIPLHRFGGRIDRLCALFRLEKLPEQGGAYYHIRYDIAEKQRILDEERRRTSSYLTRQYELAD